MSAKHLEGQAILINNKLKFECTVPGREPITVDYAKPQGDGEGIMSLELLLLSLATCLGSTIKYLVAAQPDRHVRTLSICAEGTRRETHPTVFERIHLDLRLGADGLNAAALDALLDKAKQICPVYVMLKEGVQVTVDATLE